MNHLLDQIALFIPLLLTVAAVVLVLWGMDWVLLRRHPELGNERKLPRQLLMLGLTLCGVLAVVLALPVSDDTRNQVITLIGVLLSGVIAFSSPTIVANFMAGIMLRITRPLRTGDFIRVGDHFGRVAERGLLDTEIQTDHRELVSLPNTYLISHPVTVLRSSGTIISATLSLGYDVHHSEVQSLLIAAARETKLGDPYVHIIELGNHSITYRVSGLLTEVKNLLTIRSTLYRAILDSLHGNQVEIVSPAFMNQRRLDDKAKILPPSIAQVPSIESATAEEIVFDKAEQAEQREQAKERLQKEIEGLEAHKPILDDEEKQRIQDLLGRKREELAQLENLEQKAEKEGPEKAAE